MSLEKNCLYNFVENVETPSNAVVDLLREATLTIAKEQEMVVKICGKSIFYRLRAMFNKKIFIEYQVCMNEGIIRSLNSGIRILKTGLRKFRDDESSMNEIMDGLKVLTDLKEHWEMHLRRLKLYQLTNKN